MSFKRRTAIATAALSFAAVGLTTAPASARAQQCFGEDVVAQGTKYNETIHIYHDRVEIYGLLKAPTIIKRPANPRQTFSSRTQLFESGYTFVVDTGSGSDTIIAHNNVDFIACLGVFGDEADGEVIKDGGNATVRFRSRGTFTATGGDNNVTDHHRGIVTTGSGDDNILVGRYGSVRTGAGDDTIELYEGRAFAGPGDDNVLISGEALVSGGPGNDYIHTGGWDDIVYGGLGDDEIHTNYGDDIIYGGPGVDEIFAGPGEDSCDPDTRLRGPQGDGRLYIDCELIYGRVSWGL